MNEATRKLAMALAILTMAGCGTMSHRERDTAVGAKLEDKLRRFQHGIVDNPAWDLDDNLCCARPGLPQRGGVGITARLERDLPGNCRHARSHRHPRCQQRVDT